MSSTFFGLNIAYSGLLASNAALLTTANNVSNVQTDGYSRQTVNQTSAQPIQVFQTYGCAGAGVQTLSVERIRDEFYDEKYWKNNTSVGEYTMKAYYMEQMEGYFYDDGHNAGFTSVFDRLMTTGLQELMKDPSSASLKSQFVGYASALTDYFNSMCGNLQEMQADINSEIKLKVDEINSLANQIATLNKQINTIEMTGPNANELRDERDLLIDQLSEIVDVEVSETPVVDTNNPDRVTGANRYIVRIAGGQMLVDSSAVKQLGCVARANYEKLYQSDIDGLYDIYWLNDDGSQGQKFSLYNEALGGGLRGLIQMRDGSNGEYFSGTISEVEVNGFTDANGGKHDLITVDIDNPAFSFLKDLNKSNLSDSGGVINLGNQEFYYDSWEYVATVDASGNANYQYRFVLSNDSGLNPQHVTNDRQGKIATIGANVDYQGIPYYMSQMNEWIRTFSQKFNDVLKKGNDNTGTLMLTGDHATDANQYQFEDPSRYDLFNQKVNAGTATAGDTITISSTGDSYYRLTAENMSILTAMVRDPSLMTNRYSTADGVEQSDLLKDLSEVATNRDVLSFRGSSANEFLQNVLSDVALNAANANTFKSSFTNIQTSIQNTRLSIYGVDEDEEAVNLVKYQNAYNLAAKMIQTFSEIYDRLILETGV